ncbi:MAG TPA: hypothetical protein VFA12_07035 [Stellaceae bacterium]|nr:hypothetical protein [Stellaceae bacterium]
MLRHIFAAGAAFALAGGALAQTAPLPETTLSCSDFKKQPDGSWVVVHENPFKLGDTTVSINQGTVVKPKSVMLMGTDFYAVLEAKCHG